MYKISKDTFFVFTLIFKVFILFVSLYFIYQNLFVKNDFKVFTRALEKSLADSFNCVLYFLVALMMCLNWLIESFKWKLLIRNLHEHTLIQAVKAVLAGLTLGVLTPNRIGELAGKLIYLKKEERITGFLFSGVGSLAQFTLTFVFGVVAMFFMSNNYAILTVDYYDFLKIISFVLIVVVLFLMFNKQNIKNWILKANFSRHLIAFSQFSSREISYVFLMAASRYVIFFFQFFILLFVFDVVITIREAFVILPSVFFIITIVPTFVIADIGVRGAVSVFFLGFVSSNSVGVFSASLCLWLFNIAIPVILGNLVILQYRFTSKLK